MPYVARKSMTVLGHRYKPQDQVPIDDIDARLAKKLIDQRRVLYEPVLDQPLLVSQGATGHKKGLAKKRRPRPRKRPQEA